MYHTETARITQVCWDGEPGTITFRQSRLLKMNEDEYNTPDILLLLHWMACIPLREPTQTAGSGSNQSISIPRTQQ